MTNPARELDLLFIREALENAILHVDGKATYFSSREKTPVLWRLRKALEIIEQWQKDAPGSASP